LIPIFSIVISEQISHYRNMTVIYTVLAVIYSITK
jgi:hypothetical protein